MGKKIPHPLLFPITFLMALPLVTCPWFCYLEPNFAVAWNPKNVCCGAQCPVLEEPGILELVATDTLQLGLLLYFQDRNNLDSTAPFFMKVWRAPFESHAMYKFLLLYFFLRLKLQDVD